MKSVSRMILVVLLLFITVAASSCGSPPAVKNANVLEKSIEKTMKTMNCPGVVFAVQVPGKSDVIIAKGVDDLSKRTKISTGDQAGLEAYIHAGRSRYDRQVLARLHL